ncbi:N-ethylmaleimide reductase [BD1-7 clade bacterium]|uniref:N-ethylmaleimide reductase n=1 Tax=BD1-7 clade bacterium TaxID=2029982 RepID=A0A5S9QJ61_9GAMM|nr:N-ethylmaleimide reductase [BD1-7 clade bacterium]
MSESLDIFSPIQLGSVQLKNRVVMAPLTRTRAQGHIPNALMAEYYAQRAGAGLIIAEATMIQEDTSAFMSEPGIYSDAQIEGWREVTDAVHSRGGKIFVQIWHGGRACHPLLNGGKTPVAASAIPITHDEVHTPEGKKPYTTPKALPIEDIPSIIDAFRQATINAKAAGFDGVEIHAANGYLLDNFLRDGSNKRSDTYGGPIENRARLLLEVVDAVIDAWDASHVGIRTSPLNGFNSMSDSDPVGHTTYLAEKLNSRNLAYWHLMRSDFAGNRPVDVVAPARALYQGNLIGNMGYTQEEASLSIANNDVDAVAFGMPYIPNPDLVERFRNGAQLNEVKAEFLYSGGAEGYTDYPAIA